MNGRISPALTRVAGRARWLGLGPVWRGADRIEAVARLVLLALLMSAVPVTAVAVGRWDYRAESHAARVQAASGHEVRAVLTQRAPESGRSGVLFSPAEVTWVPARWTAPDGQIRTGEVLAPAGASKGTVVLIRTSRSGTITGFPQSRAEIVGDAVDAAMDAATALVLALLAGWAVTRWAVSRRLALRLAAALPPRAGRAKRRRLPCRRNQRRAARLKGRQAPARRRSSGRREWAAGW